MLDALGEAGTELAAARRRPRLAGSDGDVGGGKLGAIVPGGLQQLPRGQQGSSNLRRQRVGEKLALQSCQHHGVILRECISSPPPTLFMACVRPRLASVTTSRPR